MRDRLHRSTPCRLPERHEIPEGGYLVYVAPEDRPDSQGRVFFTAFWWDEDHHAGPRVRAQVFNANIDKWEQGRTVQRWDGV